jgi:hypothetical protein
MNQDLFNFSGHTAIRSIPAGITAPDLQLRQYYSKKDKTFKCRPMEDEMQADLRSASFRMTASGNKILQ